MTWDHKTIDDMRQALASEKPWVRRFLRTWIVVVYEDLSVAMSWFGGSTGCLEDSRPNRLSRNKQYHQQSCRLRFETFASVYNELLWLPEKDINEHFPHINTDWCEFNLGGNAHIDPDDRELPWRIRVPTDLVIEAMRLMHRKSPGKSVSSRGGMYTKRARRRIKQHRTRARKRWHGAQGSHGRWATCQTCLGRGMVRGKDWCDIGRNCPSCGEGR